ncbi:hypothetical protein Nmel_003428 [Mimus melanotis]
MKARGSSFLCRTRQAVCHRAGTLVNNTAQQCGGVTALFTVHILLLSQAGNLCARGPRMAHVLSFCQGWVFLKQSWVFLVSMIQLSAALLYLLWVP